MNVANVFVLTIDKRTAAFGERTDQERHTLALALQDIAQELGSGAPVKGTVKDRNGAAIGTYAFGPGAVNP
jgi:hypothetical protein